MQLKEKLREHRICVTIHYGSRNERKSRILKSARDKGFAPEDFSITKMECVTGGGNEGREQSDADGRR